MNVFTLKGRVGQEPEVFVFDDGNAKVQFSIADNSQMRKESDKPTWYAIDARKELVEPILDAVHKGSLVVVQGTLRIEEYTNKEGAFVRKPVIRLEKFRLLDGHNMLADQDLFAEAS